MYIVQAIGVVEVHPLWMVTQFFGRRHKIEHILLVFLNIIDHKNIFYNTF
jgi:hypothetical protein